MAEVRFEIRPGTEEWGREDDDRWRSDLVDLQSRFERELPKATVPVPMGEKTKGMAELTDVVVSLGSAGAITAAVELVKVWVRARPGTRSVRIEMRSDDGRSSEYKVEGDGLGAEEVKDVAIAALDSRESDDPPREGPTG